MSDQPSTAELYLFAVDSFVEFARTLDEAEWATPVPCTPGWSVRDVLSHVAGLTDDALAGRMEGAPGEAWTAAQVERNRDVAVDDLLDRWSRQAPAFAEVIEQIGERRPPIDCHSHEHDIRHALGRPGERDNAIIAMPGFAVVDEAPVRVVVELADGSIVTSGTEASASEVTLRGATAFELFRSRLGRRSREQVRAAGWVGTDGDIDAVLDRWFIFGPSPLPITE
jgi:uncharacterized protein (TIGR03083 family)